MKTFRAPDGCEIYAEALGDPRRPHVVLVHGVSFSSAVFDDFCKNAALLEHLYMVRYDLRGHGRSGKPEDPQSHVSDLYAADFMAVVDGFHLDRPVFVGWSFGGSAAVDVFAARPDIISGIFYLSSCPGMSSLGNGSARPSLLNILVESTDISTATSALHRLIDLSFRSPRAKPLPFLVRCSLAGMQTMQSPRVRQAIGGRQHDAEPLWKALKGGLPVFHYAGTHDELLDSQAVEKELRACAQNLEVLFVDGGGHCLFWEDGDAAAQAIARFVKGVKSVDRI